MHRDWLDKIGYEVEPAPTEEQLRYEAAAKLARDQHRRERGWSEDEIKSGVAVWEHA